MAVVSDPAAEDSVDVDSSDVTVELDDSRSELAQVYLTVLISSSKGVRKDTRFSAGNMGREAILRGTMRLLARMELRLWGCLYGIVQLAESLDADVSVDEDRVEAESGVQMLMLAGVGVVVLMSRRSFAGGPGGGAMKVLSVLEVLVVVVGSYALLKVLRTVGETVLSVSRRNEAALPKTRGWWVLTVNLGRCDGREGIIGSEVAMVDCSAGDDAKTGGVGCDIVESIICRGARARWAQTGSVAGSVSLLGWAGAAGGLLMDVCAGRCAGIAGLVLRDLVYECCYARVKACAGPRCF